MNGQILIVDDEPIVRRAVHRILSHLGYEIIEMSCGNDAVRYLSLDQRKNHPEVRMICLDWLMPHGSGRDVLTWLKASKHPTKVVIMTAYGSNQIKEELKDFSVNSVMTKPFDDIHFVQKTVSTLL